MKKILALFLAAILGLSLVACEKEYDFTPMPFSEEDVSGGDESVVDVDLNEVRYFARELPGYAWIKTNGIYRCISTDGKVMAVLQSGSQPLSYIYNGVSIVADTISVNGRTAVSNYRLVDFAGKDVFSTESLGITGFIFSDLSDVISGEAVTYRENELLREGFIMVYRITESYDGVKYEIGTLNTKGEWVYDLSEDHPIIQQGFPCSEKTLAGPDENKNNNMITLQQYISYAGEKKLYFIVSRGGGGTVERFGIYDLETHTAAIANTKYTGHGNIFYDGFASWTTRKSAAIGLYMTATAQLYKMKGDGEVSVATEFPGEVISESPSADRYFVRIRNREERTEKICLYDQKGVLIKDFADLHISPLEFVNGYAPCVIGNSEDTYYFTIIDKAGVFKFEPVNFTHDKKESPTLLFDGKYTIIGDTVYDDNGGIIKTVEKEIDSSAPNNGVFRVSVDGKWKYINCAD